MTNRRNFKTVYKEKRRWRLHIEFTLHYRIKSITRQSNKHQNNYVTCHTNDETKTYYVL